MSIFLLKSILSLLTLLAGAFGMYEIYAVFGLPADSNRAVLRKRLHRISGYIFILLFLAVAYLCVSFSIAARTEPSPRASLHILLSFAVAALLLIKVSFLRLFRQLYEQAKTLGTVIGVLTFVLVGISAGYYLAVSRLGQDRAFDRSASFALRGPFLAVQRIDGPESSAIRTDRRSIERGRLIFASRCAVCHDPLSTRTIVGPGLQGLLKNPKMPFSGHPATAESIRFQLKQPLGRMPSFSHLTSDEVEDLIAYLNTL